MFGRSPTTFPRCLNALEGSKAQTLTKVTAMECGGPYVVALLQQMTTIFEWYMAWLVARNGHNEDT